MCSSREITFWFPSFPTMSLTFITLFSFGSVHFRTEPSANMCRQKGKLLNMCVHSHVKKNGSLLEQFENLNFSVCELLFEQNIPFISFWFLSPSISVSVWYNEEGKREGIGIRFVPIHPCQKEHFLFSLSLEIVSLFLPPTHFPLRFPLFYLSSFLRETRERAERIEGRRIFPPFSDGNDDDGDHPCKSSRNCLVSLFFFSFLIPTPNSSHDQWIRKKWTGKKEIV